MTSVQRLWVKKSWDFHSKVISELDVAVDWGSFDTEADRCWCCGHTSKRLQKCHIVPKSIGGDDSYKNIIPLCAHCHDKAPDVNDYFAMFDWIKNQQNPYSGLGCGRYYESILLLLRELRIAEVDMEMLYVKKLMRCLSDAYECTSPHGSQAGAGVGFSQATREWAIKQAVQRYKQMTCS